MIRPTQQVRDLKAADCEEIFAEQLSSKRKKLTEAITFIRKGDMLVVTRLDRLARSTPDLLELRDRIKRKAPSSTCSISATPAPRPASWSSP